MINFGCLAAVCWMAEEAACSLSGLMEEQEAEELSEACYYSHFFDSITLFDFSQTMCLFCYAALFLEISLYYLTIITYIRLPNPTC